MHVQSHCPLWESRAPACIAYQLLELLLPAFYCIQPFKKSNINSFSIYAVINQPSPNMSQLLNWLAMWRPVSWCCLVNALLQTELAAQSCKLTPLAGYQATHRQVDVKLLNFDFLNDFCIFNLMLFELNAKFDDLFFILLLKDTLFL